MIENIEKLGAELQSKAFGKLRSLAYRTVYNLKARADDGVPPRGAKGAVQRARERRFVEPLRRRVGCAGSRIADQIRPVIQLTGSTDVDAEKRRDGYATGTGVDAADQPAFSQAFWSHPARKKVQVISEIRGEPMPSVEARHRAFSPHVVTVLRERNAPRSTVDPVRRVIDRLRPGIGDVEIQPVREALLERRL